jgi:hypothetical protein
MARPSHNTNGEYTNPEVRYERADIAPGTVLNFGIGVVVLIAASIASMWWLFAVITRSDSKTKVTDLPPAAVDSLWTDRLPPQPRLEAFEDLHQRNVKLMPPRARDSLAKQQKLLTEGDANLGIWPIKQAIDEIKLPARKGPGSAAPESFSTRLPSKASSRRSEKGAQR